MNMIRCGQGHFFDGDKYASCPYCNRVYAPSGDLNETVAKQDSSTYVSSYEKTAPSPTVSIMNVKKTDETDLDKTISHISTVKKDEKLVRPVVGWLVCISGPDMGKDYRLVAGHNFVGRADDMNVSIKGDNAISRSKHCVVTFEPVQTRFYVSPGESHELSYLNGNVVLSTMQLVGNDILTIGKSKLIFIPCCSEVFHWDLEKKEGEVIHV